MKIVIDLEAIEPGKKDWLLNTLNYGGIPFAETEPEWTEPEIEEHNREIDQAVAEYERGEYLTMEQVEKETVKWRK